MAYQSYCFQAKITSNKCDKIFKSIQNVGNVTPKIRMSKKSQVIIKYGFKKNVCFSLPLTVYRFLFSLFTMKICTLSLHLQENSSMFNHYGKQYRGSSEN